MAVYLMYHELGDDPIEELRYTVSAESFRAQMAALAAGGYEVTGVGPALAQHESRRPRVVVTFDDGYASDRHVAAPVLYEHGFGATFYVVPSFLGRPGYMTETDLLDLMKMGFEIGSHSYSHLYLSDLDAQALEYEVAGSRQRLEEILGRRVRHFACPGGRVSRRVRAAVQEAGYESLATSRIGANGAAANPFDLARVAMFRHTPARDFDRLCREQGLLGRRLPELILGGAKLILGNAGYDRLRRTLLSHR